MPRGIRPPSHRAAVRRLVGRGVGVVTGALPPAARAATPERANTSRAAREDAVHGLPLAKMDEAARNKADSVLKQVSVFRRLPTQVIDCDPSLYLFLVTSGRSWRSATSR
jgi:hypothetical protein